jgi:hypothetical protein
MSLVDWTVAIRYAKLINVAYAAFTADPASFTQPFIDQLPALGYQYIESIYGNELATDVDPHLGKIVCYGYLATSTASGELIAVLRGTETILEWLHDFAFLFVPDEIQGGGGLTEDGFTAIYRSLRAGADPNAPSVLSYIRMQVAANAGASPFQRITITGHSLGAALATLLALDTAHNSGIPTGSTISYTYASPRVGELFFNHSYNSLVPKTYRIFNRPDIVPKTPLPPYEHVGTGIELIPAFQTLNDSLACYHALDTYLWLMGIEAADTTLQASMACRGIGYPPPVTVETQNTGAK